jgi:dTDP-4-dehydrorhamnose reductase
MQSSAQKKVLVLGASGMLGNAVLRYFVSRQVQAVTGTVRSASSMRLFAADLQSRLVAGVDVENFDSLAKAIATVSPDVVINCIGYVKQLAGADDPLAVIPINTMLPHRLAQLCAVARARLIHISTDCVFSGSKGMYREEDYSDAKDLYGRSKYLGEVDYPHAVTLRTSIIGHELNSAHGLLGWFLSQQSGVRGYRKAVFSGFPTVELARIMHDIVIPNESLHGLFHVSAEPIDKFTLLNQVAKQYAKKIEITPDDAVVIDRSLDSTRFRSLTGYRPPSWPDLVAQMHAFG